MVTCDAALFQRLVADAKSASAATAAEKWDEVLGCPLTEEESVAVRFLIFHAGAAFLGQFWETEDTAQVDAAVALLGQATRLAVGSPDEGVYRYNLALAHQQRFEVAADSADLTQSVAEYRAALRANGGQTIAPHITLRLGQTLRYAAKTDATGASLDQAISILRSLVTDPSDVPEDVAWDGVHELAKALVQRHRRDHATAVLDEAVDLLDDLVRRAPRDTDNWPAYADTLSDTLVRRYDVTSRPNDLDRAYTAAEQADAVGADDANSWMYRANLLSTLELKASSRNDIELLESGLAEVEQLHDDFTLSAQQQAQVASTWGAMLSDAFDMTGSVPRLQLAVALSEAAVAATDPGSDRWSDRVHNLAIALRQRYIRLGAPEDLERAVELHQTALANPSGRQSPSQLNSMANTYRTRHDAIHDPADLEHAIELFRSALNEFDEASADRAMVMNNLGAALAELGVETDRDELVAEAVGWATRAVDQSPEGSLQRLRASINLGNALSDQYRIRPDSLLRERGLAAFRAVMATPNGAVVGPETRFQAGINAGDWCSELDDWAAAAESYGYAQSAVNELVTEQLVRSDKESWLRDAQGLSARVGYALVRLGRPVEAAAAVERGLAVLLTEALERSRLELERLRGAADDGAATDLESALASRQAARASGDLEALEAAQARYRAVLASIGGRPEFRGFARQQQGGGNLPRLSADTLSYLIAAPAGGAALVISGAQVTPVELPLLTSDEVSRHVASHLLAHQLRGEHRQMWTDSLDSVGHWLGEVLEPLITSLSEGAKITLIPAGQLGLLPLHAAWMSDPSTNSGKVYWCDVARIGYLPNAAAARDGAMEGLPSGPRRVLTGPGLEADHQPDHDEGMTKEPARATARIADLVQALALPGVVHLDCHGLADLSEPLNSGVRLADGSLTIRELLTEEVRADLVVLAACETAVSGTRLPDESVSLPSAFLQVGARASIGSLWAVPSISTGLLMRYFYKLCDSTPQPPPIEALRLAQRWLRDATNDELSTFAPSLLRPPPNLGPFARRLWGKARNHADPQHWAGFVYVGG